MARRFARIMPIMLSRALGPDKIHFLQAS
jgi:hypothetical protein